MTRLIGRAWVPMVVVGLLGQSPFRGFAGSSAPSVRSGFGTADLIIQFEPNA